MLTDLLFNSQQLGRNAIPNGDKGIKLNVDEHINSYMLLSPANQNYVMRSGVKLHTAVDRKYI